MMPYASFDKDDKQFNTSRSFLQNQSRMTYLGGQEIGEVFPISNLGQE